MDMADDSVIVNGLEVDDLRWVIGGFRWCVCMYMCVGGCIIIWVRVAGNGCGWLKMGVGGCRCVSGCRCMWVAVDGCGWL